MAFDSLKQPEISTSRLSRLSFHFQELERSTVETGRLIFADAGSVQLGDDDRRGMTFMTEPKQQYGLCISNVERMASLYIVCGTTIVAFILENFIFIGTDTRATDYSGSVTRTNVNKLRLLTEHIVGATAGDGAACLGLWVHLRGLIRDYNENETRNRLGSKRSSDRLGVKVVARWALDYLKRKNEHDTEIVIAGYESTGIDVNDQYPQSYTSVVIGSGAPAAKLIFDPQIYKRQSLSVESAKLLSLDALIAGAVEDSETGDSLNGVHPIYTFVYQMVLAGGYEIQLTRDVLGGYTERYNHLNMKPENEGRVLFDLNLNL